MPNQMISVASSRKSHISPARAIRLLSGILVVLYACFALVGSGNRYSRSISELDQSSIIKTVSGVSEFQCVLRCRGDAACKTSFYESEGDWTKSQCHFLKDDFHTSISGSKSGFLYENMPPIGMHEYC